MSADGYLPPGVESWHIPGNDQSHYRECPAHEDSKLIWSECKGVGECVCYPKTWLGRIRRYWHEKSEIRLYGELICQADEEPECECDNLEPEYRYEAADNKATLFREMGWD